MIKSFKCKETEAVFKGLPTRKFQNIRATALRKLRQLDAATKLTDLATPPGNHLEALKGDRAGQHSIRVNDQWRVCFKWDHENGNAYEVEIVDYHS